MDYNKLGLDASLVDAVNQVVSEGLKGNQHKLDKNKNGKLDSQDFKMLRKEEEEVNEESDEKLDEARVVTNKYSWGTMKTVEHGHDFSIPLHPEHHQAIAKLKDEQEHKFKDETGRHWVARRKGDKVHFNTTGNGSLKTHVPFDTMKEEVEQIDELSKATLGRYIKKASTDAAVRQGMSTANSPYVVGGKYGNFAVSNAHMVKSHQRLKGIEKATNKLTKEEAEELDELSKTTLGSYVKKAANEIKHVSNMQGRVDAREPNVSKRDTTAKDHVTKRLVGLNKAINKLTKEQMEEIEALAAKHGLTEE